MTRGALAALVAAVVCTGAPTAGALAASPPPQALPPYSHLPSPGNTVRLDGTLGGASTAWAYADRDWLEQYLKLTIDAAASREAYNAAAIPLQRIAEHVTAVPNGTSADVEDVQPFSYGSRLDVEVRVLVQDGPMRGRELWTTCGELVDSSGHSFLRM